jgi:hypothetical protein
VPYGQQSLQRPSQAMASQQSASGHPSQRQVALPGSRPSQRQAALRGHRNPQRSQYQSMPTQKTLQANSTERYSRPETTLLGNYEREASRYTPSSRESISARALLTLPSVHEAEPSQYSQPSQLDHPTYSVDSYHDARQRDALSTIRESELTKTAPTMYTDRPLGAHTRIIRPGEPHQFGSRTNYEQCEVESTLCRCKDPYSHGDAYTMLNSPRGYDIYGKPIDWQEVKRRMLDHYGKDQISHAEEVAAFPHIYDTVTAFVALQQEENLKRGIRAGYAVGVNIAENNTSWHNEDGHAKPHLTQEGAKTRFNRGGGNANRYGRG